MLVEAEIARQGGGKAKIYDDVLAMIGSRRVIGPGLWNCTSSA
jgi:hypothetical protein